VGLGLAGQRDASEGSGRMINKHLGVFGMKLTDSRSFNVHALE
jgi:hypothetical protein